MKKNLKYIILALVAIVFVGTFVALWKNSRPKEIRYEHLEASVKDIHKTSVVTGKIIPRDEVNIKPQISGIISELYKEAGEMVAEGEIIAKVKVIPEMSSLSSAQSRVRLADINLKQAQTNYDREKALYDKNLVSAEEYDQVRQALAQAKEEKAAAIETLEVVRDGVSKSNAKSSSTLIRSTISGLILDIPVKVGNSVTQSNTFNDGTTIATVANMGDLIFDGFIDETEVGRVSEGVPMKITVGALKDVTLDAVMEFISRKPRRKTEQMSSRSRPLSLFPTVSLSVQATAPTPRSSLRAWTGSFPSRRAPWLSRVIQPLFIKSRERRNTTRPLW